MNLAHNKSRPGQNLKSWSKIFVPNQNFVISKYEDLISQLKSCKQTQQIAQIHGYFVKTGLDQNPFNLSKLLASSVHNIQYAASIFEHIQNPNLFMFNTMLRGYSISDDPKQAFGVFNNLRARGLLLDQFSYITTLKACARDHESASILGQVIHGLVVKSAHALFINVKNTLLHFFSVSGKTGDAHKLFDEYPHLNDLVSWNTLMDGYLHVSQLTVVVDLFRQICRNDLKVSARTVLSILCAVGDLRDLHAGESLHGHCIKIGFYSNMNVVTALIHMYAKLGDIDSGHRIFVEASEKDVILWNCMIDRCAKSGLIEESIDLLQLMKLEQVKVNSSTLVGLLAACAASGSLTLGQCIADHVEDEVLALDANLGTAMVDMYAKCGDLDKAIDIFQRMESKDVKSWTAVIFGYGVHGQARNAVTLFHRMEEEGFRPNVVTLLAVLSVCSHGGLVEEGMEFLERMVMEYSFSPKIEHYGCLVDLLGRAGLLEEAHNLIKSLPIQVDATSWRALLSACRVYGNVRLGEYVKSVLIEMNDEHPTDSILVSSAYTIAGRQSDRIQKEVGNRSTGKEGENKMKEAGCSIIEMVIEELESELE